MNALQGTDMLLGGFMSGLESIHERNQERAEIALHNDAVNQCNAWIRYADGLERVIDRQAIKISLLQKEYEGLKKDLIGKGQVSDGYQKLVESCVNNIKKLEASLARQSADAFALTKMRDRFIEELTQIATSPNPLLDSESRLALHKADWEEYLKKNVPPRLQYLKYIPRA